jgi:hypothetical protein
MCLKSLALPKFGTRWAVGPIAHSWGSICGGDEMEQFDKKLTAISKLCITVKLLVFTHSSASSVQYNKWNIHVQQLTCRLKMASCGPGSGRALLAMAGHAGRARRALGVLLLVRLKSAATEPALMSSSRAQKTDTLLCHELIQIHHCLIPSLLCSVYCHVRCVTDTEHVASPRSRAATAHAGSSRGQSHPRALFASMQHMNPLPFDHLRRATHVPLLSECIA